MYTFGFVSGFSKTISFLEPTRYSPSQSHTAPLPTAPPPAPEAGELEMVAFLGEVPAAASRGHCEAVLLAPLAEEAAVSSQRTQFRCPHSDALSLSSPGELTQLLGFSIRRLTACGALFVLCPRHSKPRHCPCLWLKTQSPESCPVPSWSPVGGVGGVMAHILSRR